MRNENIIKTLDRFFSVSNISNSGVKYDCRREYYELYKAETFEDFEAVADLVNNRFGKRILTVGLLTWRNGVQTKRVYDGDVFTPYDAAEDESIYCGSDFETNDLHVVRNEYLEDEFESWEEPIKEIEDEDEKAELLASLRHTEDEIREMMADDKVLYYNAQMNLTEDFAWNVYPRYPVAWDYDTENYQMVLLVSDDYEDMDFEDGELNAI